ncbi:MAG: phosphatidate cytidylyltransferase, partial [Neisseria sp.]|nr:phosphatidate cytidylyltransferase [Neisseria sp.]
MLKQRIITALILLPIMLGMLFWASSGLWAVFAALIALVTLQEYVKMTDLREARHTPYLAGTAVFFLLAAAGGWQLPGIAWLAVLVFWFAVMPLWLKNKWTLGGGMRALVTGWLLAVPFWFALVELRGQGALSLLAVMGLVWVADIGAYFCGKAFGKRKIAPAISPGKTWEGAVGGTLCVLVYLTFVRAAGWLGFDASWFATMIVGIVLTAVSIGGDLLESWFKRAAGVKDSSNLLPGHGGVFDRVDSLLAVLSVY